MRGGGGDDGVGGGHYELSIIFTAEAQSCLRRVDRVRSLFCGSMFL